MFEKFTSGAREAVVAAQAEARQVHATRIGTVHLFLGVIGAADPELASLLTDEGYTAESVRRLLSESSALGGRDAEALESIGIDLESVRASLESTFGEGALDEPAPPKNGWLHRKAGHIAFAAASKKALEHALREAIARKESEIRCEHLLLGLIRGADDDFTAIVTEPDRLRKRLGKDAS
ncbi:Clp protease N-terminal domain-containing protein [Rhodococcus sp. G-MC3]|uniref:Clp protease N-terminal domain-containing protein n=1 Tax=Rhodococcus sp. G-MC3 TaxID=3046209 RepID=UPI0024BBB7FF|nr:Clp protease N-terminal domain-containing protein [Rhodococcus sp. G-MC3]MDJ0392123.1 Clp protease N-terminal domain-containing protein [Rhodococcus sp. G-MC3]